MKWFKQKIKVRNCIRRRTYRYFLFEEQAPIILQRLTKKLGEPLFIEAFGLFQFDVPEFTMRMFQHEAVLTVIYKNELTEAVRAEEILSTYIRG